jgi:hypothetical protein
MPLSDMERGWGEVLQTPVYIQNNIQAYACTRCFAHPKSENSKASLASPDEGN